MRRLVRARVRAGGGCIFSHVERGGGAGLGAGGEGSAVSSQQESGRQVVGGRPHNRREQERQVEAMRYALRQLGCRTADEGTGVEPRRSLVGWCRPVASRAHAAPAGAAPYPTRPPRQSSSPTPRPRPLSLRRHASPYLPRPVGLHSPPPHSRCLLRPPLLLHTRTRASSPTPLLPLTHTHAHTRPSSPTPAPPPRRSSRAW